MRDRLTSPYETQRKSFMMRIRYRTKRMVHHEHEAFRLSPASHSRSPLPGVLSDRRAARTSHHRGVRASSARGTRSGRGNRQEGAVSRRNRIRTKPRENRRGASFRRIHRTQGGKRHAGRNPIQKSDPDAGTPRGVRHAPPRDRLLRPCPDASAVWKHRRSRVPLPESRDPPGSRMAERSPADCRRPRGARGHSQRIESWRRGRIPRHPCVEHPEAPLG
ncbi:MAG: hypothetical protein BWY66_01795 [bacterium ADurb.Bin374]|nr:MAG: hypothetical protein BWY66_01795 [bacterium ADurb.Bin374]